MKRTTILVASIALFTLVMGTAPAAADTFPRCIDAYNYGWNTTWEYVSASMNRAACDTTIVERAEAALARVFRKTRQIEPGNSEAAKVCYYQGVYASYIGALAVEYDQCGLDLGITPSVARAAVSIFVAMQVGLEWVDDADVDEVFDGVYWAPPGTATACVAYIEGSDAVDPGRAELIETVCRNR